MTVLRSLLFNVLFYLNLMAQMVLWTPYFFSVKRRRAFRVPVFWARSSLWLLSAVAGTRSTFSGQENLPPGAFILAPKHQSFWDVIAMVPFLTDPVYILKRELTRIPLFGWYLRKMQVIPVDRGSRANVLKQVTERARLEMQGGRQLVIYPEGTRRAPGDAPAYKYGIVELYTQLGLPVVPVAHAAGLFWPRRKFLRYPGVLHARFLQPIPPGLPKAEFMRRLIAETEAGCDQALVAAASQANAPPLPPTAVQRLAELRATAPGSAGEAP